MVDYNVKYFWEVIMFVKRSWNTKAENITFCYQIVKSFRPGKGKKPRTKVLANITKLPKSLIDKITLLLKSPDAKIIKDLKDFFEESLSFGAIVFLYLFMKRIKIMECMKAIPLKSRILLTAVILNRILEPRSKLGSVSWVKKTAFPILFGIEKKKLVVNQIYKAMDILYKRLEEVEGNFFRNNKKETTLLLYDITSIFFEGNGPKGLARQGYNRDKKEGNSQILLCLCLNEEKLPIYFDILEGNLQDKSTVISLIKELEKRYSLKHSIFVGDRGMVTVENLRFLEEEGIDYIVALKHRQARELIFEKKVEPELFDEQLPITIYTEGKKRYVLCGSRIRKQRDEMLLKILLEKGKKALEEVAKMVDKGYLKDKEKIIKRGQKKLMKAGCENFYDFTYRDGVFEIIEKTTFIQKAKKLCGYYILETTKEDMADKEIERQYKGLKFVEEAFRQLKDIVEIRPIFHWKERRVRTHIFLCILAQTIVNKVKDRLKEVGWIEEGKENTFAHFLDIFDQISLGIFKIEEQRINIITKITKEQKELMKFFGMQEKEFINFTP